MSDNVFNFGANSYEFSHENDRVDFKDFSISPKFKDPASNDELEKLNPLTKESITSALDVEWTSGRFGDHQEGRCVNNPHIQVYITHPSTLRRYSIEHVQSVLIQSNI